MVGETEMPENTKDGPLVELLTIEEVAAILKVPVATMRKWRTTNEGRRASGLASMCAIGAQPLSNLSKKKNQQSGRWRLVGRKIESAGRA
jgi:hypothetical protein